MRGVAAAPLSVPNSAPSSRLSDCVPVSHPAVDIIDLTSSSLVCWQGNEKVSPTGSLLSLMLCFSMKFPRHSATWSNNCGGGKTSGEYQPLVSGHADTGVSEGSVPRRRNARTKRTQDENAEPVFVLRRVLVLADQSQLLLQRRLNAKVNIFGKRTSGTCGGR